MSEDNRRFDPHQSHKLLNPDREAHWDPPRFLKRLGILSGQHILDIGAGPGFWTLPLAEAVGPFGRVVAMDISQELLDILALRHPPAHVSTLLGELPRINLPNATFDLVWAAFVVHEVSSPETLASEMRRLLRPGGRAVILEWRPDAQGQAGPPKAHRVSPVQVGAYLLEGGFKNADMTWSDEDTYLMQGSGMELI